MKFPRKYKSLSINSFSNNEYLITPIRFEDRMEIMKWRNEQMYHLRQAEKLTIQSQNSYFENVVSKLFEQEKPNQLLFSYLKNDICIGYGGLVHINWELKTAEVSFIMKTSLEKNEFEFQWSNYLKLLKKIAFQVLNFNSIFTYAYNLRPHLYPVLEKNDFKLKEQLRGAIEIEGENIDVLIHQCINPIELISIRKSKEKDMELIFNWSNDPLVRSQSFNSDVISLEEHKNWYKEKLTSSNALLLVNEYNKTPAGLVRFEIKENQSTVGILIANEYRGKGLSFRMLTKSIFHYFNLYNQPVFAYIKESNKASIKAFEKAGFYFFEKTTINSFPTFVYKIEKNE